MLAKHTWQVALEVQFRCVLSDDDWMTADFLIPISFGLEPKEILKEWHERYGVATRETVELFCEWLGEQDGVRYTWSRRGWRWYFNIQAMGFRGRGMEVTG